MAKHLGKATLMVIESLLFLIVYSADINYYVASIEDSWVPTAFHVLKITCEDERDERLEVLTCIFVGGCLA
jgi:hypothetical protein